MPSSPANLQLMPLSHTPNKPRTPRSSLGGRHDHSLQAPPWAIPQRLSSRRGSSQGAQQPQQQQQSQQRSQSHSSGGGRQEEKLKALSLTPTRRDSRSSYAASVCSSTLTGTHWMEGTVDSGLAGTCTAAGMDMGVTKTNQDSSFLMGRPTGGEDFLCGVIDGHGANGHHVSSFVKGNLAPRILEHRRKSADRGTRAAMVQGFVDTADRLRKTQGIDSADSGAVVAVCMRKGGDLYTANVGDTRAVLVSSDDRGRVVSHPLTRDHTPAITDERERIRASGGKVAPTFVPGQGFAGPMRVWQKTQVSGGLTVTRAIGDNSLCGVGVTPEPDVVKRRLKPSDKYVVLASDGCWDYISNERAAEIAMQHDAPKAASEAIVKEARRNWQKDRNNRGYIDDITCLVAKI